MKLCIVGASGKLGRYMVHHALDRGHEIGFLTPDPAPRLGAQGLRPSSQRCPTKLA